MSAAAEAAGDEDDGTPEPCLCGRAHPCPRHSKEGIQAEYLRLAGITPTLFDLG